jgi:hypothetical protein
MPGVHLKTRKKMIDDNNAESVEKPFFQKESFTKGILYRIYYEKLFYNRIMSICKLRAYRGIYTEISNQNSCCLTSFKNLCHTLCLC